MNVVAKVLVKAKMIQGFAPVVLAVALFLPWTQTQALPFTSDIIINGIADYGDSLGFAVDVVQAGSYSAKQGGVTTTNSINGNTVTGRRPLAATLSEIGDGFGITGSVDGAIDGGEGRFPVDIGFSIFNNSISAIYKLTLQFDYNHSVTASGGDAYAASKFSLFDDTHILDLILRDVVSDTFFGDHKNGAGLTTFGAAVTDSGTLFLDLFLNPGDILDLAIEYEMNSGVYSDPGSMMARFSSFLSVASVERVEVAIPAPATFFLMLAGGLALMTRRRQC